MSTLKTMSDEELALAYIDGNNRAFDELLTRNQEKRKDLHLHHVCGEG